MKNRYTARIMSFLIGALLFASALLPPASALAGAYDPNATLSQFIYGQSCEQF